MTSTEPFQGTIGRTYQESEPWWAPRPEDAHGERPNVVIILLDDTGFAHLGCYGSLIDTPNIDALAANGLRFSNFHVTPLCSPTRAVLLTGRNHHSVGMRTVANLPDGGFPNRRATLSKHAATLAEMLQVEGYATYGLGKWHLNNSEDSTAAGPFDNWPLQRGFDRYYGFLGGATDQFYPELIYDNHQVDPPNTPEEGYHLTEDLADHAIGFLRDTQSSRPRQPFFLYFATGAMHDPHQAPREYIEKYRGRFDAGWDVVRQQVYERQLAAGVIPADTELAPRNPGVVPWKDTPDEEKPFMRRLQETFAGFLEHTDAQIGRVIDYLKASGQLDNTILLLLHDNGTSQSGGPTGVVHAGGSPVRGATKDGRILAESYPGKPYKIYVDDIPNVDLDEIGGPRSSTDLPWGWAQVGNTPLRWYKADVHGGGVRVPLIVHWPDRLTEPGTRHQFHHVSDIVPTVLELLGVEAPRQYRGIDQIPVHGTPLAYTFDHPEEPSRKPVQYFEMDGHRGIWMDGWKAVTRHVRDTPYGDDEWELYHLAEDFSELNDLAASEPQRLREMIDQWWVEAGRYDVLPLDDRHERLGRATARPGGIHAGFRYHYTPPISHLPTRNVAPALGIGEWEITADIERADTKAEGVLYVQGAMTGGISFYIQGNRLHLAYNSRSIVTTASADAEIPPGRVTVGARLAAEGPDGGGRVTLVVAGADVGSTDVPSIAWGAGRGGADVGLDRLSPVTTAYDAPFPFSGVFHALDVVVARFPGPIAPPAPEEASMDK